MDKFYKQCKLKKGNLCQVSYLPEQFCEVGKVLKLKEDEVWEDGWQVVEVYPKTLTHYQVNSLGRDYSKFPSRCISV